MLKKIKYLSLITVFITCFMTKVAIGETTPILQIDTKGHQALIRDIMFTNNGKYLVSASNNGEILDIILIMVNIELLIM